MPRQEMIGAPEFVFACVFEPAPDGGYVVTCPALPGLVAEGDSLEEARSMAADAIQGYLESLRKDGLPFPEGEKHLAEPIREGVKVRVRARCRRGRLRSARGRRSARSSELGSWSTM